MDDYLIFQLYASLASWGAQAVGQERPTDDHPSRSALLGLIAASLGIHRDDEEKQLELSNACRFGIKLLASGLVMRDFHTIQTPPATKKQKHLQTRRDELNEPKLGTILSYRSYYQDSVSVVAVTSDSSRYGAQQIADALLKPFFHLYLGRKSCPPALPLNPKIVSADNLKSALDDYDVYQLDEFLNLETPRYYWEEGVNAGMNHDFRTPRYGQPISRQRWQFAPRDEFVCLGGD